MKQSGISMNSMTEPAVEKIASLSRVQRIQVCVVTGILLIGFFSYFFFYPQYNKLDALSNELRTTEKQLADARTSASQINRFRQEMKAAEDEFKISRSALPDKEEIPSLLTSISQSGHDMGLEFLLFEPKPEILKDFYAEIPVDITVSGYYHSVGGFFDKVANLSRVVTIRNIRMTPSKDGKLMTTCQAVTYKFVEPKPAPVKGAKP